MADEDINSVNQEELRKILKDKQQMPDDVEYLLWLVE